MILEHTHQTHFREGDGTEAVKVRDGFHMKHFDVANGTRYRAEARRVLGHWMGEVYLESRSAGSSGNRKALHTIEDEELVDSTDGDEVCDLAWQRYGLEG